MRKEDLKKNIAQQAYNAGYGAKKHFATYDIVEKVPGWIGFISMAIGIASLAYKPFSETWLSLTLIVAGLGSMYITMHSPKSEENLKSGEALIAIFHKLRLLFGDVEATTDLAELSRHRISLEQLQADALKVANAKQIFGADWYAHFKLFGQSQTKWFVDELKLTFWRDMLPRSFTTSLIAISIAAAGTMIYCAVRGYIACHLVRL